MRLLQRFQLTVWIGLLFYFGALTTEAMPITWTLSGVKLEDGSSIAGYFTFDASMYAGHTMLTDFQISISGGSVMPALLYTPSNRLTSLFVEPRRNPAGSIIESVDAFGDRSPAAPRLEFLYLVPTTFLPDAGGTVPLQLTESDAQLNNGEVTVATVRAVSGFFVSAPATAVPEPNGPLVPLGVVFFIVCRYFRSRPAH